MAETPKVLRVPAVIETPTYVHAWCALGHSWVTTMVRRFERVEPRKPKQLLTLLETPYCPDCGRSWQRCSETRHG